MSKIFFKQLGTVRILLLASLVAGLLFFGSYVFTVQAETKTAGPLVIEYPGTDPLFSATNIAPGYTETKTLTVTNNGTVPHSFAIAAENVSGELADVIEIKPRVGGLTVWILTTLTDLANWPNNSKTIIGSIAPGETRQVDIVARIPVGVGNAYQGKSTSSFKFIVGPEEEEPVYIEGGGGEEPAGPAGRTLGIPDKKVAQITNELISAPEEKKGEVAGEGEKEEEKGEIDGKEEGSLSYLWWLIPLLIFILLLFLFLWRRRKKDEEES